jgi:hypothetical protein
VNAGLSYINDARATDPFIKAVAVIASQVVSSAIEKGSAMKSATGLQSQLQITLADLKRKAAE